MRGQEPSDTVAAAVREKKRARVIDAYVDGTIEKAERDRRLLALDAEAEASAARNFIDRVPALDWDWAPGQLNQVLRALWSEVTLGADMEPLGAVWRVPEWRAP